jgi:hypothetical protein
LDLDKTGKKLKNINYDSTFAFKIYCRDKNNWLAVINSVTDEANYQKYGKDTYHVEKWDIDINKYRKK